MPVAFFCECGAVGRFAPVFVSPADFAAAMAASRGWVLTDGHGPWTGETP